MKNHTSLGITKVKSSLYLLRTYAMNYPNCSWHTLGSRLGNNAVVISVQTSNETYFRCFRPTKETQLGLSSQLQNPSAHRDCLRYSMAGYGPQAQGRRPSFPGLSAIREGRPSMTSAANVVSVPYLALIFLRDNHLAGRQGYGR